jgi:hypothetical protein
MYLPFQSGSLPERKAEGIVPEEAFTGTRVGEGIRSEKGQFQIVLRPMSLVLEHFSAMQADRLQFSHWQRVWPVWHL